MTQQLWPTPRRNSSHWWTASHMPVRTSDWPSVWRRWMSWDRIQKHRRSLPSTIMNSMLSANSPTSAPPSPTTSLLDAEINKRIGKAASTFASLTAREWASPGCLWRQTWQSAMAVLSAHYCMAARRGLHMPGRREGSTHSTWEASWQDKVTNADVLSRAGLQTMYTLLRQRRLRWLVHVRRMEDGRIPKYILYGELALGRRTTGRPHLR